MSKKKNKKHQGKKQFEAKVNATENVEVAETNSAEKEEIVSNKAKKAEVQKNNKKANKKKDKKPNIFKRFGRKCKEVFSELKKVSWPTFSKVLKQTGVVLGVVLIFLILVTAIDFGLTKLLGLLTSKI